MATTDSLSHRKGTRRAPAATVAREMGLAEAEIAQRLAAVRFTDEDRARVRGVKEIIAGYAGQGTEDFLHYLRAAPAVLPYLRQPAIVDEIRALKRAHIAAMAEGDYGLPYVTQRIDLALLYGGIELDVKWFLGAFQALMRGLGTEIMKRGGADPDAAFADYLSLEKIAAFDVAMMVDTLTFQREQTIRLQQQAIRELSTPVLQVRPGLLVLPLIGIVDSPRALQLTEQLLRAIRATRAKVVLLDITGVAGLDSKVANHLLQTVEAARLMGATTILSGVSPEVAQTVVTIGVDLGRMHTVCDMQRGVEEAERLLGYQMVIAQGPPPAAQE